jgi:zinc transport system substrate-binding protein
LDALDTEIASTIAPVKNKPFIVFHDAYQYFERRYGVHVAGSITVSPESIPGAQRVAEIHGKVADLGATCVFAEPQFEPKLVNVVIEGTSAKSGVLDPEAATLPQGPDLYFDLMRGIANSLKTCLS